LRCERVFRLDRLYHISLSAKAVLNSELIKNKRRFL
jgi:hypothetical protein